MVAINPAMGEVSRWRSAHQAKFPQDSAHTLAIFQFQTCRLALYGVIEVPASLPLDGRTFSMLTTPSMLATSARSETKEYTICTSKEAHIVAVSGRFIHTVHCFCVHYTSCFSALTPVSSSFQGAYTEIECHRSTWLAMWGCRPTCCSA